MYVNVSLKSFKMSVNSYLSRILKEIPLIFVENETLYHVLGTVLSSFYLLISLMSHSYPLEVDVS